MVINKYKIREQNEALILKAIIDNQNISRAELSVATKLNKASVSSITKSLLNDNLIIEKGEGTPGSSGGRKPIMLEFNPSSATVLTIDLGTNYVKSYLSYLDGTQLFYQEEKNTIVTKNNVELIIKKIVSNIEIEFPKFYYEIIGLTLAIHGIVLNHEIIFTPNYDLDKINLYSILSNEYPFPIYIENEANLSALAEYAFSANVENLVSLSIHSGIGAGIVEKGEIQKGCRGEAGEIGHSTIYPNGIDCICGNKGCLEKYASKTVLYNTIKQNLNIQNLNSDMVVDLFNEKKIIEVIQKNAYLLSIGINNLITIYDPEMIIINSSVYSKIPTAIDYIKQNLTNRLAKNITIVSSELGQHSTLLGGNILATQHFLNITALKFR